MGQSQGYYQGQYGGSGMGDIATGAANATIGMAQGAVNAASGVAKGAVNVTPQMGGRGFGFMTRRKHRKMRKSRKSHKKRSHRRR